jgi:imidazoleglycerol phosphate dehydratase HisB
MTSYQLEDGPVTDEGPGAQRLAQIWRETEETIRDRLFKIDASEAMEGEIAARMKQHFDTLTSVLLTEDGNALQVQLSGDWAVSAGEVEDIGAALGASLAKVLGRFVGTAVNELLDLEIRLYQADHPWG